MDIRPADQRAKQGDIPGATVIDRNVLEWRTAAMGDQQARVIIICAQGYQSSLAAANLQDLGLVNATDVIGGFESWVDAGLPTNPPGSGNIEAIH